MEPLHWTIQMKLRGKQMRIHQLERQVNELQQQKSCVKSQTVQKSTQLSPETLQGNKESNVHSTLQPGDISNYGRDKQAKNTTLAAPSLQQFQMPQLPSTNSTYSHSQYPSQTGGYQQLQHQQMPQGWQPLHSPTSYPSQVTPLAMRSQAQTSPVPSSSLPQTQIRNSHTSQIHQINPIQNSLSYSQQQQIYLYQNYPAYSKQQHVNAHKNLQAYPQQPQRVYMPQSLSTHPQQQQINPQHHKIPGYHQHEQQNLVQSLQTHPQSSAKSQNCPTSSQHLQTNTTHGLPTHPQQQRLSSQHNLPTQSQQQQITPQQSLATSVQQQQKDPQQSLSTRPQQQGIHFTDQQPIQSKQLYQAYQSLPSKTSDKSLQQHQHTQQSNNKHPLSLPSPEAYSFNQNHPLSKISNLTSQQQFLFHAHQKILHQAEKLQRKDQPNMQFGLNTDRSHQDQSHQAHGHLIQNSQMAQGAEQLYETIQDLLESPESYQIDSNSKQLLQDANKIQSKVSQDSSENLNQQHESQGASETSNLQMQYAKPRIEKHNFASKENKATTPSSQHSHGFRKKHTPRRNISHIKAIMSSRNEVLTDSSANDTHNSKNLEIEINNSNRDSFGKSGNTNNKYYIEGPLQKMIKEEPPSISEALPDTDDFMNYVAGIHSPDKSPKVFDMQSTERLLNVSEFVNIISSHEPSTTHKLSNEDSVSPAFMDNSHSVSLPSTPTPASDIMLKTKSSTDVTAQSMSRSVAATVSTSENIYDKNTELSKTTLSESLTSESMESHRTPKSDLHAKKGSSVSANEPASTLTNKKDWIKSNKNKHQGSFIDLDCNPNLRISSTMSDSSVSGIIGSSDVSKLDSPTKTGSIKDKTTSISKDVESNPGLNITRNQDESILRRLIQLSPVEMDLLGQCSLSYKNIPFPNMIAPKDKYSHNTIVSSSGGSSSSLQQNNNQTTNTPSSSYKQLNSRTEYARSITPPSQRPHEFSRPRKSTTPDSSYETADNMSQNDSDSDIEEIPIVYKPIFPIHSSLAEYPRENKYTEYKMAPHGSKVVKNDHLTEFFEDLTYAEQELNNAVEFSSIDDSIYQIHTAESNKDTEKRAELSRANIVFEEQNICQGNTYQHDFTSLGQKDQIITKSNILQRNENEVSCCPDVGTSKNENLLVYNMCEKGNIPEECPMCYTSLQEATISINVKYFNIYFQCTGCKLEISFIWCENPHLHNERVKAKPKSRKIKKAVRVHKGNRNHNS